MKWTLLLVPLLIGCSETAEVELTAPEVMQVEQFTVTEEVEEPSRDMGLEPVIFVGHPGGPYIQALEAMGQDCSGMHSLSEWLASPAGQMFLGMEHCEDYGLGIDHGLGPSPPEQPDGGSSAGGGGGGAD
jgi:hypothetical protein